MHAISSLNHGVIFYSVPDFNSICYSDKSQFVMHYLCGGCFFLFCVCVFIFLQILNFFVLLLEDGGAHDAGYLGFV